MKKIIIPIILFITFILVDIFLINGKGFKVEEEIIKIKNLPASFQNFKIMQISDTLIKNEKEIDNLEKIVKRTNQENIDIIFFTGDLFSQSYTPNQNDIEKVTKILKKLNAKQYKYAVIGDEDTKDLTTYENILTNSDFKILNNESTYLFYKNNIPLKITGLTNLDNINKSLTIEDNLETAANIVITHYPDYFSQLKNENIDLIFAGHSLLGQIRLPIYGGILKDSWATKYLNHIYYENETTLYVSGGIGTKKINVRLFNKPEINLYKLKQTD